MTFKDLINDDDNDVDVEYFNGPGTAGLLFEKAIHGEHRGLWNKIVFS
jgi:hypothetical protein